jgi:hypothetical protein
MTIFILKTIYSRCSFCGSYMEPEDLAKRIRDACLEALLQAYEDAGVQGLCAEGRWEVAVGALKTVDLAPLLREFKTAVSRLIG